jgi:hypothetical protein
LRLINHRLIIDAGQASQLRAVPDRDNPADRNHRLARRAAHQLRDVDGTAVTLEQARAIIAERYATPKTLSTQNQGRHGNAPAMQGVAKRSINRSVQANATTPQRLDVG